MLDADWVMTLGSGPYLLGPSVPGIAQKIISKMNPTMDIITRKDMIPAVP